MKIYSPSGIQHTSKIIRKKGGNRDQEGEFASLLGASESEESKEVLDVTGPAPVGGLFALQEISDEEIQRKKQVRQGFDILDSLDRIRLGLLEGAMPLSSLTQLSNLIRERISKAPDPALSEILNEIELRALVEKAKLEKYL